MSRPIKCWDSFNKKWLKEDKFYIHPSGVIMIDCGVEGWEEGPNDIYKRCDSTGLHDRAGKEIWEGDIVRIQHPEDKGGDFGDTVGHVFWWGEEGAFYHGNSSGRPPKRMWEYCEVLGNVYENGDLLK